MRTAVAVALIVLCGRALVDDPLAHATGGPALPAAIAVSAGLALALSSVVLAAAAEHVLAWMRRTLAALRARRVRPRRVAVRCLSVASAGRPRTRPFGARGPPQVVL